MREAARDMGGRAESTLVGFGGKTSAPMAAFVNGALTHPIDYDDTIDEFINHPSGHTFPAALAVSEKIGNATSKEFITAMAIGLDLNVRLSAAPLGNSV